MWCWKQRQCLAKDFFLEQQRMTKINWKSWPSGPMSIDTFKFNVRHVNHSTMVFQAMVHNNHNKAVSFKVSHDFLDRNDPVTLPVPPWKLLHLRLLTTRDGGAKQSGLSWEPLVLWFHKIMGMTAGVGRDIRIWSFQNSNDLSPFLPWFTSCACSAPCALVQRSAHSTNTRF